MNTRTDQTKRLPSQPLTGEDIDQFLKDPNSALSKTLQSVRLIFAYELLEKERQAIQHFFSNLLMKINALIKFEKNKKRREKDDDRAVEADQDDPFESGLGSLELRRLPWIAQVFEAMEEYIRLNGELEEQLESLGMMEKDMKVFYVQFQRDIFEYCMAALKQDPALARLFALGDTLELQTASGQPSKVFLPNLIMERMNRLRLDDTGQKLDQKFDQKMSVTQRMGLFIQQWKQGGLLKNELALFKKAVLQILEEASSRKVKLFNKDGKVVESEIVELSNTSVKAMALAYDRLNQDSALKLASENNASLFSKLNRNVETALEKAQKLTDKMCEVTSRIATLVQPAEK